MGGGPPGFPRGFSCPAVLGILPRLFCLSPTGLLPSVTGLSRPLRLGFFDSLEVPQPHPRSKILDARGKILCRNWLCQFLLVLRLASNLLPLGWFRLFPFRSPLLRESSFLSLPPGTKMFQFPGLPSPHLCVQCGMTGYYSSRVSPFGYLRINACLRLPEAFRSLPRPSSTLGAKASTVRSY